MDCPRIPEYTAGVIYLSMTIPPPTVDNVNLSVVYYEVWSNTRDLPEQLFDILRRSGDSSRTILSSAKDSFAAEKESQTLPAEIRITVITLRASLKLLVSSVNFPPTDISLNKACLSTFKMSTSLE